MVRTQGLSVVAATHDTTLFSLADVVREMHDGVLGDPTEHAGRFRGETSP